MKKPVIRFLASLLIALISIGAPGANIQVLNDSSSVDTFAPLTPELAQKQLGMGDLQASAIVHQATLGTVPPTIEIPGLSSASPGAQASAAAYPPPLNTLANAVTFIQDQRYTLSDGSKGLPNDFYVPAGENGQVLDNNPDANRLVREGSDLYDNSLAIMALMDSGDLTDAQSLINISTQAAYGTMDLRAEPNFNGHNNNGAFAPFNSTAFYLFSFVRASGNYSGDPGDPTPWSYYTPSTGENAWMVMAIAQYVELAQKAVPPVSPATLQPYIDLASDIGNGMVALQNAFPSTQGGIRASPMGTYFAPGTPDPYNVCYTENNVSAYAALNALYTITKNNPNQAAASGQYKTAAGQILNWLQNATVYIPSATPIISVGGTPKPRLATEPRPAPATQQKGMLDPSTGMLYWDATYNPQTQHWEIPTSPIGRTGGRKPILATDGGGTWTISSLGPQTIDGMFGQGAALKMWESTRAIMGRTATPSSNGGFTMQDAGTTGRLDGLDYSSLYPANQSLISPEWTAGGINAVKQLISYYGSSAPSSLESDMSSMQSFISQNSNSYAVGPGLTGSRLGRTGYGWQSPPADVTAMASIYQDLQDPLALTRQ